jgi:hypothetical protein
MSLQILRKTGKALYINPALSPALEKLPPTMQAKAQPSEETK